MSRSRVLVLARAPVPGRAKTRLIPALGARGAAELHAWLVRRTLATVTAVEGVTTELWCDPATADPFFRALAAEMPVTLRQQCAGDLGARMSVALRDALASSERAVLIGTDCVDLAVEDLREALARLATGADAVLGPVADGGYWLIGLRRWHPNLFEGIRWGGEDVLEQTRGVLTRLGWAWHELSLRHDVDRPEDLARLPGPAAGRPGA